MTEQPNPKPNDEPEVWPAVIEALLESSALSSGWLGDFARQRGEKLVTAVIADMRERDRLGRERYGVPLQPHNGRDALLDMYEELLDACAYGMQVHMEGSSRRLDEALSTALTLASVVKDELRARDEEGWS